MIATTQTNSEGAGALGRFFRYAVRDSIRIARKQGIRELIRQRGWRFVAGVIAYYLVRDTCLYVLIPLIVAKGLV